MPLAGRFSAALAATIDAGGIQTVGRFLAGHGGSARGLDRHLQRRFPGLSAGDRQRLTAIGRSAHDAGVEIAAGGDVPIRSIPIQPREFARTDDTRLERRFRHSLRVRISAPGSGVIMTRNILYDSDELDSIDDILDELVSDLTIWQEQSPDAVIEPSTGRRLGDVDIESLTISEITSFGVVRRY